MPQDWKLTHVERKSADGVALGFVVLWAIGDVLNLAGSVWAHLVPTTIMVAVYYIFSDLVIILEVLYYRSRVAAKDEYEGDSDDETSPLIEAPAELFVENERRSSVLSEVLYNVGACLGVTLLGALGWYLSTLMMPKDMPDDPSESKDALTVGPQILGYTSAMLYLCARIPQIFKNYRKKKTDGLALLFFIFSVFGNLTYAASILAYSQESEYLITNISWLLGSLGTLAFDFVILFQFLLYRQRHEEVVVDSETSLLNT